MHDSKLLALLKTIQEEDHTSLLDFFQSPYFNKNEKIIKLVKHLLQFSPDYQSEKLSKEFCYQLLYPETAFEDARIRRLMSKTLKLLEQFITYHQLKKEEVVQHQLMANYCIDNDLEVFFKSQIQSWEKKNKKLGDYQYFFQSYLVANAKLRVNNSFLIKNMRKNVNKAHEEELQNTLDKLQNFYLYKTLHLTFVSYQNSLMFNTPKNEKIETNSIKAFFEDRELIKFPSSIQLFYMVFMFFQNQNQESYQNLKNSVSSFNVKDIDKKTLRDIYKILEVYVIHKQTNNINGQDYYSELLELYKYELEQELVFYEQAFYPVKFRNMVVVALRIKEYEWTEQFIQDYHHTLPDDQLPSLHHYCLALLYFHQKRFQEAADLLFNITDCKDAFFMFDIKRLQIKTYYEQDEIDLLDSMMNAFRVQISRDSFLSEGNKLINKHFINMVFRLVGVQSHKDIKKLYKMQDELNSNKAFAERPWLLSKVEEKMTVYAK